MRERGSKVKQEKTQGKVTPVEPERKKLKSFLRAPGQAISAIAAHVPRHFFK